MANIFLVGYFGIFVLAVLGMGRLVTWSLRLKFHNAVETVIVSYAFGSVVYSYFFHLLGFLHLLYGPLLIAGYALPAALYGYRVLAVERRWHQLLKARWWQWPQLRQPRVLGPWLLVVVMLFPLVPYMFLYPASWDVLAYHLPLPKFYLQLHHLPFVAWFAQTGFPIGIEALYGLGEAWREPRLSHLIHFSYIFATVSYLLFAGKQFWSVTTRWLAAGLFLFQPMLYSEAALSAFVDYPFAFFTLITVMTTVSFFYDRQRRTLLAVCLLAGFLPLIKFSGLLVSVSLVAVLGWQLVNSWRRPRTEGKLGRVIRSMWLPGGVAMGVPVVWFVRNYWFTRNPFYPFYNAFFKGLAYEPGGKEVMKDDILHNAFVAKMVENLWTTVDTPQDYVNLAAVLFLIVGCGACLWLLRDRRIERRIIAQMSLVIFILLMVTIGPLTRYVFFIVPLLSILIAVVVVEWQPTSRLTKSIVMQWGHGIFVLAVMITALVQVDATFYTRQKIFVEVPKRQWLYFLNAQTARAMLYEQDNYRIQEFANQHLDPNHDKVLQLLDNRIYYLDIPNEFATTILGGYFTDPHTTTGEQAYQRIKADGFTHAIKLNAWGAHPVMKQEVFNSFYTEYLTPMATGSGVTLYQIK